VKRPHIGLKTKLAAALLEIDRLHLILHSTPRQVPYEKSKTVDDDYIIAQWHWDHYPHRHGDGGPSQAWNLVPIPALEHRAKTAKVDVPQMAKSKRIRAEEEAHRVIMAGALPIIKRWKRKIPSRPFSKIKRKFANKK